LSTDALALDVALARVQLGIDTMEAHIDTMEAQCAAAIEQAHTRAAAAIEEASQRAMAQAEDRLKAAYEMGKLDHEREVLLLFEQELMGEGETTHAAMVLQRLKRKITGS
jgi:hypothetical protein